MDLRTLLSSEFAPFQTLSELQLQALNSHYQLVLKWNKKINLCRFKDTSEAVQLHYCESLYLGRCLPEGGLSIADVGSGAGFPGVPIGILRPECQVDLLESDQRKGRLPA